MLQSIRDKASGWLAYVIIGLIAIPFALWGLGEYFGGGGPLVAAEVNGQEIPVRVVQQETRVQRDQIARMFGGQVPPEMFDERVLRNAALESLIQRELLRQAAEEAGFRASAAGVIREIRDVPAFLENGQFSPERYRTVLEAQRIAPGDFERDIAQSIVLSHIQQAINASGDLPTQAVSEYARLRNQVRVASWKVFATADFDRPDVVDPEAVAAFYNENPERFTTPERLQIAYLRLDPSLLEADVDVSEQDVRDHYEVNLQRYTEPELRQVRQLLVSGNTDDAEGRIRDLRARLDAGAEFAELARESSEDSLSAARGGDLGRVARGDLDPVLETVIFSLPEGLISQPVQTRLGWHIVEVTAIEPPSAQPFDEVREEVERDLRDRRAEQRQIQILDDLLSQTFENPDSLVPASRATGLEIRVSDWFTRESGEGVAALRPVREAAFSSVVRNDGRNSEPVDLPDGSTLVLRLEQRQEPSLRPLDQVAAEIRELLQRDAAAQAARAQGESLAAELRSGARVADLAEADPDGWTRSVSVHRMTGVEGDVEIPPGLTVSLFRMPAPDDASGVGVDGVRLANGDFAVVVLEAVETVALEDDPAQLRQVADDLQMAYAGAELDAYLAWLESEAKIQRYPGNLE
jgi:peptidyl-prolyl cis-trans isomerase D